MFLDAREFEDDTRLQADVCIVGAGVAGITLARELARQGTDVLLLESGGLHPHTATQDLYDGDLIGKDYYRLDAARLRYLGGTSNHWGGNCRLLRESDFERRDWIPDSGWPFDRATMMPYYERALEPLKIGPLAFDADGWETKTMRRLDLPSERLLTGVGQFSKVRFGREYHDELEASTRIRVALWANVLAVELAGNGRSVRGVDCATLEGRRFDVDARRYVLALGGIENARLLLLSNRQRPEGVGNEHDLVGRYFMEHLSIHTGTLVTPPHGLERFDLYETSGRRLLPENRNGDLTPTKGFYTFPPALLAQRELNNGHFVTHREYLHPALESEAWSSFKRAVQGRDLVRDLSTVLGDLPSISRAVADKAVRTRDVPYYRVHAQLEQTPNRDSRVLLGDKRDALGQRRVQLDWQIRDQDVRSMRELSRTLAVGLGQAELGRLRLEIPRDDDELSVKIGGHWHHMGTTRMHDDPHRGVVDADCRVHGLSNLWIAGSSVFPTSGFSVPTFTIVALTMKLADRLQGAMS